MPCYKPLTAIRSIKPRSNGKHTISFSAQRDGMPVQLPCGQCIGCRLERSRQWAMRCVHEASLHDENQFVTLTYNNDSLPPDGGLRPNDFLNFIKKLRRRYGEKKIRYFHCGEYGEINQRPHYHAILFNHRFQDLQIVRSGDYPLYQSKELDDLWEKGMTTVGDVTFQSAAYVARYVMKKVTGEPAAEHYNGRKPEYVTMSRRPGIAKEWFDKYKSDCYPSDFLIVNGTRIKPPRYYDKLLEQYDNDLYQQLKESRLNDAFGNPESEQDRLNVRERVKQLQIKNLKRKI